MVISNRLSRCDGAGGGGGGAFRASSFFFAIVSEASDKAGVLGGVRAAGTGAGGGGDTTGEGRMPTGALPGVGNGELRDLRDC